MPRNALWISNRKIMTTANITIILIMNPNVGFCGAVMTVAMKNIKKGDFIARLNKINLPEESYKVPIEKLKERFQLVEKDNKYTIKSKNLSRSNFIKLPEKTSSELMELLGLLVSDGNISKKGDSIGFYNKDLDLIKTKVEAMRIKWAESAIGKSSKLFI